MQFDQQRRICPARSVSVFDGAGWKPEQLLGWRLSAGRCRSLVRPVWAAGCIEPPARWVNSRSVRPRTPAVVSTVGDEGPEEGGDEAVEEAVNVAPEDR